MIARLTSQPDPAFAAPAPSFDDFEAGYKQGQPQLVWRKTVSDLETPVSAYLKLTQAATNSFLLESVEGGENLGRYSIIGLEPDLIWRANGDKAEINHDPKKSVYTAQDKPTLESLRDLLAQSRIDLPPEIKHKLPPMAAGVFGYFGYDTVRLVEHLPNRPKDVLGTDDAIFIRPTVLAVFDNVKQEITFLTPVRPDGTPPREAYLAANDRLTNIMSRLTKPLPEGHLAPPPGLPDPEFTSNTPPNTFSQMVNKAKDFIKAGDIFQVVLSQRYSAEFPAPPFSLYRTLRRLNPSPFMFFLNFENCTLVGSSPEILVRVRDKRITIRPIAGTRPRGATQAEDIALEADLLADPKERAEHLMLLDLGRNDVGRSAKVGSVRVTEQFTVERYSHVMHIVSNVVGDLADTSDGVDALGAGFPAGTVSGAPKIRAMQIIDQLEQEARGPYGGCIGYFSADGNIDTCIALRTALIKDGKLHIQAGAGIVADSDAAAEHRECEIKAGALVSAAKAAVRLGSQ